MTQDLVKYAHHIYVLISSACIAFTQNTCLNCDGDASKCINCLTGYYNYAGNCYRC